MNGQTKLTGVPETMLLTLYHRALETARPDRLFADEFAVSFVERIDHDFAKFDDWRMRWAIPVRTWLIDNAVREFLRRHPEGTVITLGAGLCTRALRLDNAQAQWFSVDLAEIRPLWQELIGESARNHLVTCSVTDLAWMDRIPPAATTRPMLFVAEGLLQYLDESSVRDLVLAIRQRFPGSELVVEVLGTFTVKNTRLNPTVAGTGAVFRWGCDDCAELETWAEGIVLLDQWYLVDYEPQRQRYLARLPGMLGGKGQFGKVARLRLGTR
ncbi:class I SAM-dependent methyltransferase [Rugosimonospora acidiphila]|uniref:Class I SAM-dependent methyltransferase n=1 Tax=Rugosimonospora acidiphila TaxID=556531 RepID=A0ABP9RJM7_9ACTN